MTMTMMAEVKRISTWINMGHMLTLRVAHRYSTGRQRPTCTYTHKTHTHTRNICGFDKTLQVPKNPYGYFFFSFFFVFCFLFFLFFCFFYFFVLCLFCMFGVFVVVVCVFLILLVLFCFLARVGRHGGDGEGE